MPSLDVFAITMCSHEEYEELRRREDDFFILGEVAYKFLRQRGIPFTGYNFVYAFDMKPAGAPEDDWGNYELVGMEQFKPERVRVVYEPVRFMCNEELLTSARTEKIEYTFPVCGAWGKTGQMTQMDLTSIYQEHREAKKKEQTKRLHCVVCIPGFRSDIDLVLSHVQYRWRDGLYLVMYFLCKKS